MLIWRSGVTTGRSTKSFASPIIPMTVALNRETVSVRKPARELFKLLVVDRYQVLLLRIGAGVHVGDEFP